jgi:DNA replication protein DnaC
MKPPEPVTAWTKPAAPEPTMCACGATVGAIYIEPILGAAALTGGRPLLGTGVWEARPRCAPCEAKAQQEALREQGEQRAAAHAARVQAAYEKAGFRPREADMTMLNLRVAPSVRAAIDAWVRGEKALYIHGKDTGAGKTHTAVAGLKALIAKTAQRGLFRPVPVLVKDLRQAVGRFRDGQLLEELMGAPALVLDDMGVERPTETVLEGLYTIVDHWYANKRPHLIITSNLSLDELSKRLDDRIASRLAGHCRILELTGQDRRLPGFEERR